MKVFVCDSFSGHYPVGACAVVVADSDADASQMLELELLKCGLGQKVEPYQMTEIDISVKRANIIIDGDY